MSSDRISFFIDENLPPGLATILASIYRQHQFRTAQNTNLLGTDDLDLFTTLHAMDFDAIITSDGMQLENPGEREALAQAGLHWIGVPQFDSRGAHQLALVTAVAATGLHHVLQDWRDEPTAYHLRAPGNLERLGPEVEPLSN